jgi:gliding motility-associated-like protein
MNAGLTTFITLFFLSNFLFAQQPMLSNQGALISVKDAAFIAVHGNTLNENAGVFHNSDTIHLFGDWENNAGNEGFNSIGEGIVTLRGDNQNISGDNITRFYDLRLENSGVKFGRSIDIYVDGFLRLNDRELNMDTNVVHVFNTDAGNAVQSGLNGNFGFVSALGNGGLLRYTGSTDEYVYYLGSTLGVNRFRPLHLSPSDNSANAFRARLANTDPNNESYDRSQKVFEICDINPNFYHRIAHTIGNSPAGLKFFIDNNADGTYNGLAHWQALQWNEETSISNNGNLYGLTALKADSAVSNFSSFPFALANLSPAIDLTATANPLCSNVPLSLEAVGSYSNFSFIIDSLLLQNGANNTYNGPLTAGFHPVWVTADNGICGRTSDTIVVEVFQAPSAVASPDTIIVEGTSATIYASGGDFYEWTPPVNLACNSCPSTSANPAQTTLYTVLVESIEGCIDTASVLVEVKSDVGQVLFIPNVLTPNNDGYNDTWRIDNIQLFPSNRVLIVNRWGDVVYQSDFYNNDWDGSFGGGLLPAGTYYYILDLGQGWGIFKGDVTIIRK